MIKQRNLKKKKCITEFPPEAKICVEKKSTTREKRNQTNSKFQSKKTFTRNIFPQTNHEIKMINYVNLILRNILCKQIGDKIELLINSEEWNLISKRENLFSREMMKKRFFYRDGNEKYFWTCERIRNWNTVK